MATHAGIRISGRRIMVNQGSPPQPLGYAYWCLILRRFRARSRAFGDDLRAA